MDPTSRREWRWAHNLSDWSVLALAGFVTVEAVGGRILMVREGER